MKNAAIKVHKLGTDSSAKIVSIGLNIFDETKQPDQDVTQCVVVDLDSQNHRHIEGRSLRWWMEQPEEVRKIFENDGVDIITAFNKIEKILLDVDGIILISKHDQDILESERTYLFRSNDHHRRRLYDLEEMFAFWGITPCKVRVCPKYYVADLAAKADADTLRACWSLIKTVELGKIA